MKEFFSKLEEIKQTSSTKQKEELLLKLFNEFEVSEKFFRLVFNDDKYNIGKRSFEKLLGFEDELKNYEDAGEMMKSHCLGSKTISYEMIVIVVEQVKSKSGNELLEYLNKVFQDLTSVSSKWLTRILLKDLRCGFTHTTINKVLKKLKLTLITKFEVQLCGSIDSIDDWNIFPCYAGVKYDGMRCVAEKKGEEVILTSRQGKIIDYAPEIVEELKKIPGDFILDGEIMAKDFSAMQKRIGRKQENLVEIEDLHYRVFDILKLGTDEVEIINPSIPEHVRYTYLKDFINKYRFGDICASSVTELLVHNDSLIRLEQRYYFTNLAVLKSVYKKVCEAKGEGIIIKLVDKPYEYGSRKNWFKVKVKFSSTMRLVGFEKGSGKYKDVVGNLLVEDKHGVVKCSVGSGLNDYYRDYFLVNKPLFVEIIYNEITKNQQGNYSLRHPRFDKIRDDKEEADELVKKDEW